MNINILRNKHNLAKHSLAYVFNTHPSHVYEWLKKDNMSAPAAKLVELYFSNPALLEKEIMKSDIRKLNFPDLPHKPLLLFALNQADVIKDDKVLGSLQLSLSAQEDGINLVVLYFDTGVKEVRLRAVKGLVKQDDFEKAYAYLQAFAESLMQQGTLDNIALDNTFSYTGRDISIKEIAEGNNA